MKQLDKRLRLVADMVPLGCRMADIGTDHAYLPAYLILEGHVSSAIASDLRSGPLEHARITIFDSKTEDKIQLRLSDGLDAISSDEVDCVVMAGMGGILISQLIEKAGWLKNPEITLVLQPMTDAPLLRTYLSANGFFIEEERAIADKKHVYTVMRVSYTGDCVCLDDVSALVGKLNPTLKYDREYLNREANRLVKQIDGLSVSGERTTADVLRSLYEQLYQIIQQGE